MPRIVIGCDLSRAWLDVHCLPGGRTSRIENTSAGIAARAAEIDRTSLVVFEATSGCDGPLIAALAGRGIPFARVTPRQAREFARALGVRARTDRVDARVLAEMGLRLPLEVTTPPDPERTRLADFVRRRRQLVEMRKAGKVRRHSAGQPELLREIEGMIALPDPRIDRLDRQIAALIAQSPGLAVKARLPSAVPGVGPTVLAILLGPGPARARPRRSGLTACHRQPVRAALTPNSEASADGASPRWRASHRSPAKAGCGAGPAASGAADQRSARPSTSPPCPQPDASRPSQPCASACAPPARRQRPSSSPQHANSSSSSMQ